VSVSADMTVAGTKIMTSVASRRWLIMLDSVGG
jgi:hypothetical protein